MSSSWSETKVEGGAGERPQPSGRVGKNVLVERNETDHTPDQRVVGTSGLITVNSWPGRVSTMRSAATLASVRESSPQ